MDYTVLLGRGANITSDFKVTKLPHLFIIDQKGVIQGSDRFMKEKEIKNLLDKLLLAR